MNSDRSEYKKIRSQSHVDAKSTRKIIDSLNIIAPAMPIHIYWSDSNHIVLGGNELALRVLGRVSGADVVGKSIFELFPEEIAAKIAKDHNDVISGGKTIKTEDIIPDLSTGKTRYFSTFKSPLRDDNGDIIGILGTSMEVTNEKEEAAQLIQKSENECDLLLGKARSLFIVTSKVAHDICSPLSTLNLMLPHCDELDPEKHRLLTSASNSMLNITNDLLTNYRFASRLHHDLKLPFLEERRRPLILDEIIATVLSEKQIQFVERMITLDDDIDSEARLAFAFMQPVQLQRALSNLIDNAVQTLKSDSPGVITLRLTADDQNVSVSVIDNGKGTPKSRIKNLLQPPSSSTQKSNVHGLAWQQIWDLIEQNAGTITIDSTLGKGTCVRISFPRIAKPDDPNVR